MSEENRLLSPFRKLVTGNFAQQVIVTIFAAILYAILANYLDEMTAGAITSAIFIPVYIVIIYVFCWGVAERERNMVLYGHMEEDRSRGLRSGIFAAIPVAFFSIVTMIFCYAGSNSNIIGIYRICTAPFIFFSNLFIDHAPVALLLLALFAPFAAWWG